MATLIPLERVVTVSSSAVSLAGDDEAVNANDRLCIVRSIGLPNDGGTLGRLSRRGSALLAGAERSMIELWVVRIRPVGEVFGYWMASKALRSVSTYLKYEIGRAHV